MKFISHLSPENKILREQRLDCSMERYGCEQVCKKIFNEKIVFLPTKLKKKQSGTDTIRFPTLPIIPQEKEFTTRSDTSKQIRHMINKSLQLFPKQVVTNPGESHFLDET